MDKKYVEIIFKGYCENSEFLKNYFYREFKKAEKENIQPGEFYYFLKEAIKYIDTLRRETFINRLTLWDNYYIQETNKGKTVDIPMPEDNHSYPLFNLTNGKYGGFIKKSDMDFIYQNVDLAFEQIKSEEMLSVKENDFSIGNIRVEFIKTYNQEVTTERKEKLQNDLSKIESIEDKITFLENEKISYLQNLPPEILDVSGRTNYPNFDKGKALLWDRYLELEIERLKKRNVQNETKTQQETEQETENNFTLSTIEDWLFEFKNQMNKTDYEKLVSALLQYFETGIFPTLSKPIQINGRLNKKLFGWALNRIFEAKGKGVEKELLKFAKQNISLFTTVEFDENNIFKCNLYKYFTTQTK